jgi:hypothetical protein
MATEKIILTEINIDYAQSIKDTQKLKDEIGILREQMKMLKDTQGENSEEYIKASATMKSMQSELKSNEAITQKVITANRSNAGSLDELKAKLAVVSKQWSAMSQEERLNTEAGKKLTAQKLELTNQLKKEEAATGDARRNVGNYTEGMNGAMGSITTLIPGASKATTAINILGTAFKIALGPIGLLIAAIMALKTYFESSEEGQNRLAKAMAVFKVILGNVSDLVSKLGKMIVDAFESPKQTLIDLGNLIKENIINRFTAFGVMGKAIMKIFKGDFKEGFKELADGAIQSVTGIENAIEKVGGFIKGVVDETAKEIDIAKKLADMQASLNKRMRAEIINDAKDEARIAELRAKAAQKDLYNGEERLKMMDEAIALENAMMKDDLEIAKQKAYIHGETIKMSNSTKEDLDEQARLEAEIFNIEKANSEARRSYEKQRQAAINDIIADQKALVEETIKGMQLELAIWNETNRSKLTSKQELNQQLIDAEALRLQTEYEKEVEINQTKYENGLLSQQEYDLAQLELKNQYNDAVTQLTLDYEEQERERKLEAAQIDFENEMALVEDNITTKFDIVRQGLDTKKSLEIAYANKIGADTYKIEQKYSKAKMALAIQETQAKLSIAAQFADNIAQIAGENTKVGKAAAAASTTISAIQGSISALTGMMQSIPGPIGIVLGAVAAAATLYTGYEAVKKIYATKSGLPGDGGGGGGGMTSLSMPSTTAPEQAVRTSAAPEVGAGIVSRSTSNATKESTQLQPTLVEDEVTSKQRNASQLNNTAVV